ncbi:MAG: methyltransferase [Chitinophagaceae bacterium]
MKTVLKNIVSRTYKPLLVRYLSKVRIYKYEDIKLEISPEVFHPGFFFSTNLLLKFIKQLPLSGKRFLEPGCGSGLISIYAAKKGAIVTATDINPVAIEFLNRNSRMNGADLTIIQSDLFRDIPVQPFDIVAINPPYYKKEPLTFRDYAWHCGENGEYFKNLFTRLSHYIHPQSEVYMVLFDGCDIEMIANIAAQNFLDLQCVLVQENLLEKTLIYKIEKNG